MNKIVEYNSPAARHVRGTRVEVGQKLYAIKHIPTGLFFIWSYSDRDYAERLATRIAPGDANDRAANWRTGVKQLTPSDRKSDR